MKIEPGPFSEMEQEAIVLSAVVSMVDDMVNHTIFCPLDEKRADINLLPQNSGSLRQFRNLLKDFLSPVTSRRGSHLPSGLPKPPEDGTKVDHTTLRDLKRICENPLIGTKADHFGRIVRHFSEWLKAYAFVEEVWFGNIGKKADLRIKRIDLIRMSGDM